MTKTERVTEMFRKVVTVPVVDAPRRFVEVWNTINVTTFRITITMGVLATGTALRYWLSDVTFWVWTFSKWEPSEAWLWFLIGLAGVDAAQFVGKRMSYKPAVAEERQTVATTTTDTKDKKEETNGG